MHNITHFSTRRFPLAIPLLIVLTSVSLGCDDSSPGTGRGGSGGAGGEGAAGGNGGSGGNAGAGGNGGSNSTSSSSGTGGNGGMGTGGAGGAGGAMGGAGGGSVVPVCGNGSIEKPEACDDGNVVAGDYCAADCSSITGSCGDGTTQTNEMCDDGNVTAGDYCAADCSSVSGACGDGMVQTNEMCDDGNVTAGDYCAADCSSVTGACGDGMVQANETCDDGTITMGCNTLQNGGDGKCVLAGTCSSGYVFVNGTGCVPAIITSHVHINVSNTCVMTIMPTEYTVLPGQKLKLSYHNHSQSYPVDVWMMYNGGYTDLMPGATWNETYEHCFGPIASEGYADISTACSNFRLKIHCL